MPPPTTRTQSEQSPPQSAFSPTRQFGASEPALDVLTDRWWPTKKTLQGRTMFIKGSSLSPVELHLVESRWRTLRRDNTPTVSAGPPLRGGGSNSDGDDQGAFAAFITTDRELIELLSTLRITRQPLTLLACREALTASNNGGDGSCGRLSMLDTISVLERCKSIHAVWRHKLQGRAVDDELLEAFVAIGGEEGCETAADVGALRHVVSDFDLSLDVDSALRDLRGVAKGAKSGVATGINFLELASLLKQSSAASSGPKRSSIESYDGGDDLRQIMSRVPGTLGGGHEDSSPLRGQLTPTNSFDENLFDQSGRGGATSSEGTKLRPITSNRSFSRSPVDRVNKRVTVYEGGVDVVPGEATTTTRRPSFKPADLQAQSESKRIENAGILLSSMTYVSIDGEDFDCFDLHATASEPKHALRMYRSLYRDAFVDTITDATAWLQPPVPSQLTDFIRRTSDGTNESTTSALAAALASGPDQLRKMGATREADSTWYYQFCGKLLRSAAYAALYVDLAERAENVAQQPANLITDVSQLFAEKEMRSTTHSLLLQLPPPFFSVSIMQGAGATAAQNRRRKSVAVTLDRSTTLPPIAGGGDAAIQQSRARTVSQSRLGSANPGTRKPATTSKSKQHLAPLSNPSNPSGADTMRMFFDSIHHSSSPNRSRGGPSMGGVPLTGNADRDYKSICDRYKSKKYREKYRIWLQEFNESKSASRPDDL